MTTAAKALEEIRLRTVAGKSGGGRRPAELRVGALAHELLSDAAGWRLAHAGANLTALFGVEVCPAPALDDRRWRLLDGAGAVIVEGVVDPG